MSLHFVCWFVICYLQHVILHHFRKFFHSWEAFWLFKCSRVLGHREYETKYISRTNAYFVICIVHSSLCYILSIHKQLTIKTYTHIENFMFQFLFDCERVKTEILLRWKWTGRIIRNFKTLMTWVGYGIMAKLENY